jgi:lipoprotein-anchoring transpeptidase ErfK/SrfK
MVPSALRTLLGALSLAATALLALPASPAGSSAVPAPGLPELQPPVLKDPAPSAPAKPAGYSIARVRAGRSVAYRSKPGGAKIGSLDSRTEFGSKRVLGVVERRSRWLGVSVPERPNGKLAWIDGRSSAVAPARTKVSLRADLSRRTLELRVGRKTVKRMRVAVGRPGSSTPTGRFAVTDKLSGDRYGPYYGCCILALSGTQPNTPAGWRGGNRLAVHGTNSPGTIGQAASAGCLRGGDADLHTLMRRVPVGTPVFIRR